MIRFAAGLMALLVTVPVGAQSNIDTLYFLPKTVITISGSVTTKQLFTAKGLESSAEPGPTSIAIGVAADPAAFYFYRAESSLLSKSSVALDLTTGGVISGVNGVSEGQAGVILKNIVGLVTGIARLGPGGLFTAASHAEQAYQAEFGELAKRRNAVRGALDATFNRAIVLRQQLVTEIDSKKREDLRAQLGDLDAQAAALRSEGERLDAHFLAWKARKEDVRQQSYEWVIDADALPQQAQVAGKTFDAVLAVARPPVKEVMNRLRVVIALESPTMTGPAPPATGTHAAAVYHRVVLPSVLRVYRVSADDTLELVKQSALPVLSAASMIGVLPAPDSKWSKKSLTATFSDGALTKVGAEAASEIAGATEALRGLPAEYLAGIKQANEISAEHRKLALQSIDGRLEQLKKQKELAEAELAQQQTLSVGTAKNAITELETQIKLLETQRVFNDASSAAADRNAVRLENEMSKLQVEQAELRKKLEALERELRK